jgi:putative membrane protein
MAVRDFFLPEARKRVGEAVEAIERDTAAEIVVSVRKCAGHYSQTDLFAGLVLALGGLVYMLFDAYPFDVWWMPVNVMLAFIVGAFASLEIPPLRRFITQGELLRQSAVTAARAAFYELGISHTTRRAGVLVYVSMFERRVDVVPDVAVKPSELGADWTAALEGLSASVRGTPDFDRFLVALAALKAPLAKALPGKPGDANELPDEPVIS